MGTPSWSRKTMRATHTMKIERRLVRSMMHRRLVRSTMGPKLMRLKMHRTLEH